MKQCTKCQNEFSSYEKQNRKYCSKACYQTDRGGLIKQCKYCNDNFRTIPYKVDQGHGRFCSTKCQYAAREKKVVLLCDFCGGIFERVPSKVKEGRNFCSQKCLAKSNLKRISNQCAVCNKSFEVTPSNQGKKYCSVECRNINKRKRLSIVCSYCNNTFEVTPSTLRKFCSQECANAAKMKRIKRNCEWCNEVFDALPCEIAKGGGRFCSLNCFGFYNTNKRYSIVQLKKEPKIINWSEGIAYLIGLITSDGTLRKFRQSIKIGSKDLEMIENVQSIVYEEITGRKNKIVYEEKKLIKTGKVFPAYSYSFTSRQFYQFCIDLGLMPNKSLILEELIIPDSYFAHFLRGVVDGDGCYYPRKQYHKTYLYITIASGSYPFLLWLKSKCQLCLKTKGGSISNKKTKYDLSFTATNSIKIIEGIYSKANYFLSRKKNIADPFLNKG